VRELEAVLVVDLVEREEREAGRDDEADEDCQLVARGDAKEMREVDGSALLVDARPGSEGALRALGPA
jgi:hypothetical protein